MNKLEIQQGLTGDSEHTVPRATKIGYGVSELGTMACEMLLRLYLLIFYTDYIGLKPQLAGYAVAIAVIWDAVTDPVMGIISDVTHSRWGRRRPYILIGSLFLAFSIIILFSDPGETGQTGKFLYLLMAYILVNTAMTVVTVPHFALARNVTFDPNERVEVFGWRLFFGNIGFFAGTVLPGIFLLFYYTGPDVSNKILAHHRAAQALGVMIVAASATTFLATKNIDKGRASYTISGPEDLFAFLRSALQNKAFITLFLAYSMAMVGISLNSSLSLYFYRYRLALPEKNIQFILAAFVIIFSLSIAGWVFIARKYGKKKPAILASFMLGLILSFTYPFIPPGKTIPALFCVLITGSLVGSITLIESLAADTIDLDELLCGINREGLYFGFWKMGIKFSRAAALILTGHLLHAIGYIPNQVQSPGVGFNLALIYGPGVGVFILLGSLILCFMPLTNERHRRIQSLLIRKRAKRNKNVTVA